MAIYCRFVQCFCTPDKLSYF